MSNLFIEKFLENEEKLSKSEKVKILNIISKHINKKMKILEYKYGIELKLKRLPEDNSDCIPRTVGFQTFAQIEGPIKGKIPIYTNTQINIPRPTFSNITTTVPITPHGPFIGVNSLGINPFGNDLTLDKRIEKAGETLIKIKNIDIELEKLKNNEIDESSIDKTCFEFIDLKEPETYEEIEKLLNNK